MLREHIKEGMELRIIGNSVCHGFANGTIVIVQRGWSGVDFQACGVDKHDHRGNNTTYWVRPCDVEEVSKNSIRFKQKRISPMTQTKLNFCNTTSVTM